jgi:hypothetical protein
MASVMKSATGQATRSLACLAAIRTGVGLSVCIHQVFTFASAPNLCLLGLAVNFLLIESLQRFYQYYGDDIQVECPTGSGDYVNLVGVAEEIQHRVIHIFGRDMDGRRATNGGNEKLDFDPHFRDYVWFYEVSNMRAVSSFLMFSTLASSSMVMMVVVWAHLTKLAGM